MVRTDFALQLYLRTLRKDNPHHNPEYQVIADAIKELKRLYLIEEYALDVVGMGELEGTVEGLRQVLVG